MSAVCDRWPQGLWDGTADAVWLWMPERRQATGPMPKPRWMPLPAALCASRQVMRRRLVGLRTGWCSAPGWLSNSSWRRVGGPINTAFVERLNLDIRQRVAIGRRVNTLCQGEAGVRDQLTLFHVYHLRRAPREPSPTVAGSEVTTGRGSAKRWRPCTPAMAAGLTDHVWTLKVLLYQVPPWPQPQTV